MPGNKVHINWYKRFIPVTLLFTVTIAIFIGVIPSVTFLAGYLLGAICDPDLDQIGLSGAEGRAMRKFGILGVMWVMYWFPYGYVMPHRSFISHFPFVSTLLRLGYLFFIPAILALYFQWTVDWKLMGELFMWLLCGLGIADTLHYLLDWIY